MRILVTGATGTLGQELCPMLDAQGWQFWATNSKIFDITNIKMVNEIMNKVSLDFIIHLAGYTNIDYVSTDNVFDGEKSSPYDVSDKTNPINIYGQSKLKGEEEILKHCSKYYIIRTGWLYGSGAKNYVDTMLTFSMLRREISVVDDQIGNPTWTRDLSEQIINIMKENRPYGTYHISSTGQAGWADFTKKIFEIKKRNVSVNSIVESDFPRPAKRPKYCVLNNTIELPNWEESLEKYLIGK